MLFAVIFTALVAALILTFDDAVPTSARRSRDLNSSKENSYIVKLKDSANATSHINSLPFLFSAEDPNSPITHWWPEHFRGYSGIFVGPHLDAIMGSPDVEYVEKNGVGYVTDSQRKAPWNLQAISSRVPVGGWDVRSLKYTYGYDLPVGDDIDIYIIDTGVYIEHDEFEGRAMHVWAPEGVGPEDLNGHGTHVAGIAASKTYGIAKKASILSVKIFGISGRGSTNTMIAGINFVSTNIRRTGRRSIACMAFATARYQQGLNDAVQALINNGVTVVVSAGNQGQDVSNRSPTSVEDAIIVSASDITNTKRRSSNYGPNVDIFAPGVDINSTWIGGSRNTERLTGSSMAAAHVAGIAAYFLSQDPTLTPAQMRQKIKSLATPNIITNVPEGTTKDLVFNGGPSTQRWPFGCWWCGTATAH